MGELEDSSKRILVGVLVVIQCALLIISVILSDIRPARHNSTIYDDDIYKHKDGKLNACKSGDTDCRILATMDEEQKSPEKIMPIFMGTVLLVFCCTVVTIYSALPDYADKNQRNIAAVVGVVVLTLCLTTVGFASFNKLNLWDDFALSKNGEIKGNDLTQHLTVGLTSNELTIIGSSMTTTASAVLFNTLKKGVPYRFDTGANQLQGYELRFFTKAIEGDGCVVPDVAPYITTASQDSPTRECRRKIGEIRYSGAAAGTDNAATTLDITASDLKKPPNKELTANIIRSSAPTGVTGAYVELQKDFPPGVLHPYLVSDTEYVPFQHNVLIISE